LVATALPDTLDSKLRQIAGELSGNARGSGELAIDRLQFYRNVTADQIACEVISKLD
jgi:hypothetical protein